MNNFANDWVDTSMSTGNVWDEKAPIQGVLLNRRDNVGPNNSTMYTLKTDQGEVGVWGSTVINTKFSQIPIGSLVRVELLGKAEGKGGRQYKDYKIQYKPDQELQAAQTAQRVKQELGGTEVPDLPPIENYEPKPPDAQIDISKLPF